MKLAFFNFFTFAAIACIQTQLIPFLNELEITSIHKSWVLGISALIALLIAIIIGKISDSTGKMKPSFLISLLLYNLFFIGTIAFKPLSIRLIFFTLMLACLKQVMACAETMVFQIKQDKFGKYQIMSAFGLVFGSLLSGYLFQSFKAIALAIACMVFSCLSGGLTRKFQESKKAKQSVTFNQVKKLFLNHDFIYLLVLFFFLMMIGFADQYLVTEKLLELKATKTIIALKFALQALMECPIYWYSDKLIKKVSPISLLIFTSIMSGIKFFLYGIVHSVGFILCASLLQIFTHPLIVLTSKYFIQKTTPKQLQTSSQLVGFAFYFSCAGFVSPLLGHALTKIKDSSFALIVFAFFSIIPFFMSIMMKKRKSCVKVSNGDQNENIFN